MEKSKTFVNSEFPTALAIKARTVAAQLNLSRSELVRLAVTDFIKRMEVKTEKWEPSVKRSN